MTDCSWVNKQLPKWKQGKSYFIAISHKALILDPQVISCIRRNYGTVSETELEQLKCFDTHISVYRLWYTGQVPLWEGNQMKIWDYFKYIEENKIRTATYYVRVSQGDISRTYRDIKKAIGITRRSKYMSVTVAMDLQDRFFVVVSYLNTYDKVVQDIIVDEQIILGDVSEQDRIENESISEFVGPVRSLEIFE